MKGDDKDKCCNINTKKKKVIEIAGSISKSWSESKAQVNPSTGWIEVK